MTLNAARRLVELSGCPKIDFAVELMSTAGLTATVISLHADRQSLPVGTVIGRWKRVEAALQGDAFPGRAWKRDSKALRNGITQRGHEWQ